MAHASLQKLYTSGLRKRVGAYGYVVDEKYAVLNDEAESAIESFTGADHPTYDIDLSGGGSIAPRVKWVSARPNYTPGRTLLGVHYETPRKPGVALISLDFSLKARAVKKDLDDKILDGVDTDLANGAYAKVRLSQGEAAIYRCEGLLKLETAYSSALNVNSVMTNYCGKVNDATLTTLGLAEGTLLMLGPQYQTTWEEWGLWHANFLFAIDLDGWNNRTKRQHYVELPVLQYPLKWSGTSWVADTDADPVVRLKEVDGKLTPDDEEAGKWDFSTTSEESTRLFGTADFSALDAMIQGVTSA